MKNKYISFIFVLLCIGLLGGCVTTSSTKAPELPVLKTQAVAEDQLTGSDMAALTALDFARNDVSPELGSIRLAPNAMVAMMKPEPGLIEKGAKISSIRTVQDGSTVVEVLRRFEDGKGRTQMINDMAGYTVRQATDGELQANAVTLVADYSAIMKSGNAEAKNEALESVKLFQQQAGLAVDGVLGPQTATAMAKAAGIQEFTMLASVPVYSQSPKFTMYVMDQVLAKNDPDTYLNGFDSVSAVSAKAIPKEQFSSRSNSGGSFLAMIYFIDQLPKDSAIQVGFSEFKDRKDPDYRATMRPVYSTGKEWPVVLVPFKIERSITPKKLFAHIIINGSIVDTTQLR